MSVVSSFFTNPGQNAAEGQQRQSEQLAKQLAKLFGSYQGIAADQVGRQGENLATTFTQLQNLLGTLNEGGTQQRIGKYNANINSGLAGQQASSARNLAQSGYGSGAIAGANQNLASQAQSAKNGYFSQQYDPANVAARIMGGQQAAGQWNQMANQPLNNLMQLFANVISTPKHPVGTNPAAGIIGTIAGGPIGGQIGSQAAGVLGGSNMQPMSTVSPYNSNIDNFNFVPSNPFAGYDVGQLAAGFH